MLHIVNFPTIFETKHSLAIDNIFVNNPCLHLWNIRKTFGK